MYRCRYDNWVEKEIEMRIKRVLPFPCILDEDYLFYCYILIRKWYNFVQQQSMIKFIDNFIIDIIISLTNLWQIIFWINFHAIICNYKLLFNITFYSSRLTNKLLSYIHKYTKLSSSIKIKTKQNCTPFPPILLPRKNETKHVTQRDVIIFQPVSGPPHSQCAWKKQLFRALPPPLLPWPPNFSSEEGSTNGRVQFRMQMGAALSRRLARGGPPCRQFEKPPPENVSIGRHNSIWIMNERPLCKFRPLSKGPR